MRPLKVLVTCGPTWVAIDDVRVISNQSTGTLGRLLAAALARRGAAVTLLEGPVEEPFRGRAVKVLRFRFFDELAALLRMECRRGYDVIVHAAAVSDFKPVRRIKGKASSGQGLTLQLAPCPKLIDRLKQWAPRSGVIGFKLEPGMTRRKAVAESRPLFAGARCDFVVANSVASGYKGFIVDADGNIVAEADSRERMAADLTRLIAGWDQVL